MVAENISATLNGPIGQRYLEAFDTASYSHVPVPVVFQDVIDRGNSIQRVGHHFYQVDGGNYSTLGPDLLNRSAIAKRLDGYRPCIEFLNDYDVGDGKKWNPFIQSETGDSLQQMHHDFQALLGSAPC